MIPTLLMAIALTGGVFETMPPPEVEAKVGRANVLITPGTGGHTHFPDEPIVVLGRRPLRFLMVSSDGHVNGTYLWQGESWSTAVPVEQVLTPGDGPDNGYAGIGALIQDHGRSLAYYHAEDHRDMGHIDVNNVDGFYATVCMAILNRDGRAERLGPVLTADDPKHTVDSGGWTSQGVGEPHVLRDHTGQYLLCYYTRWTEHPRPSTHLCLARASIKHGGRPGTWDKYYQGEFREPGLGGHETPLLSGFQSQVVFVPAWKRYVMTFGMGDSEGMPEGINLTTSEDGIHWHRPLLLVHGCPIPWTDKEVVVHPTLLVKRAGPNSLQGIILYGFSPRWGPVPHHLASRTVTIKLKVERDNRPGQAKAIGDSRAPINATGVHRTAEVRDSSLILKNTTN